MLWFEKDANGYSMLNFKMLTNEDLKHERTKVINNDFQIKGTPTDIKCPAHGRSVDVRYDNGDQVKIEFIDFANISASKATRLGIEWAMNEIPVDSTIVSIKFVGAGGAVKITPRKTNLSGMQVTRSIARRCSVGLQLDL